MSAAVVTWLIILLNSGGIVTCSNNADMHIIRINVSINFPFAQMLKQMIVGNIAEYSQ